MLHNDLMKTVQHPTQPGENCPVGWLVVFNVPSTARSFRDGTPIYSPLRRTWSSINTPFQPGIEPRAVAWQSITLPLRYASSRPLDHQETGWVPYKNDQNVRYYSPYRPQNWFVKASLHTGVISSMIYTTGFLNPAMHFCDIHHFANNKIVCLYPLCKDLYLDWILNELDTPYRLLPFHRVCLSHIISHR